MMFSHTHKKLVMVLVLLFGLVGGSASAVFAISIFDISLDTSSLTGTAANLAFDLIDGDGASNNVVTLTNFSTDGALGTASSLGGPVTGALPGPVTIADGSFFNELLQPITLGTTISFTLDLTENFAGGLPDQFSFFLLDGFGFSSLYATTDLTGADALFVVDIDGTDFGALQVFTPTTAPAASLTATPVPEPGTLLLFATGLVGLVAYRVWGRGTYTARPL